MVVDLVVVVDDAEVVFDVLEVVVVVVLLELDAGES